jgi:pyruvate dehydrogenase E2 component (dihydrolipoamide acetyltransferase)
MAVVVRLPKLSDTMEEGAISSWQKKVGDFVEEGDLLAEIETDKATMEYSSPEEGYLLEILVEAGKEARLSQAICILGKKGEKYDKKTLIKDSVDDTSEEKKADPSPKKVAAKVASKTEEEQVKVDEARLRASPLAKKIAKDRQVDLRGLTGSGPSGRIIARDLEQVGSGGMYITDAAPVRESVSMMRKTIAKRLTEAKHAAPHFYLKCSAKMDTLLAWRQDLNKSTLEDKARKVSINDLIVCTTAKALAKHPLVNSSWQGDHILINKDVHMAVAVALPEGLITPVIRHADKLKIVDIAQQTKELIALTRAGKLTPEQYSGGTFTISNLGMTCVEDFTAIINPPQAAILAVGKVVKTPVVNSSAQIVVEDRITLTLSCDHRLVDGLTGARFLETLVGYIENPVLMSNL